MANFSKNKSSFIKIDYLLMRFCDIKDKIVPKNEYNANLKFLIEDFKMEKKEAQILMEELKKTKIKRSPKMELIEKITHDIIYNYEFNELYPISNKDFRVLFR